MWNTNETSIHSHIRRKIYVQNSHQPICKRAAYMYVYMYLCLNETDIVWQYLPINHVNPLKIYRPYKRCVAYVKYILHIPSSPRCIDVRKHIQFACSTAHFHSIKWNFHQNFKWPYVVPLLLLLTAGCRQIRQSLHGSPSLSHSFILFSFLFYSLP